MIVILSSLNLLVAAQDDCASGNFQPCLDQSVIFKDSTCEPLATKNATFYNDCLCYNYANQALCYAQCPGNATIQAELKQVQIPKTEAQCKAQGLNYLALPNPPTWQYYFPSNGVKPTVPQSTVAPSVTSKPAALNSAVQLDLSWALGLIGFML